ncbi:hypothetical protein GCM10010969_21380 [Saccharibacillus kuerlensis]|uniref:Uncharacterized protein n=1 Tax=Saccharibacillus kuerlensis TaxID=459527 RepID=A0ABQ2L306_9BACL|nr:hypothetical protein GCM10010969_21380 [Saccharibacillus kuerlensis]
MDVNVNVDAAQNGLRIGMDTDTGSPSEPLFAQSDPEEMFLPQSHEPFCNDFMNALSKDPLSEDFLRKKRYEERD